MKSSNSYASAIENYRRIPKAVLAAVAFAFAARGVGEGNETRAILAEWLVLHENGIVPQAPPKKAARRAMERTCPLPFTAGDNAP